MAKISDESVRARTGKDWETWFSVLDESGAAEMNHREIVAILREKHGVAPWWQQAVAVGYEQARGLRKKHEAPDGFQVSASRTIDASVEAAYHAWVSDRERLDWLPDDHLIVSAENRNKSLRGTWAGGASRIDVYFIPREPNRVQITVNHSRLEDSGTAERMKAYWRTALDRLQTRLEGHAAE